MKTGDAAKGNGKRLGEYRRIYEDLWSLNIALREPGSTHVFQIMLVVLTAKRNTLVMMWMLKREEYIKNIH